MGEAIDSLEHMTGQRGDGVDDFYAGRPLQPADLLAQNLTMILRNPNNRCFANCVCGRDCQSTTLAMRGNGGSEVKVHVKNAAAFEAWRGKKSKGLADLMRWKPEGIDNRIKIIMLQPKLIPQLLKRGGRET